MDESSENIELHPSATQSGLFRPDKFTVAATGIGPKGEALRLLVTDSLAGVVFARTEQPGWASFPKTQTETEYSAILTVHDRHEIQEISIPNLSSAFPRVQVFPNGEILIVASRCQRFADGSHELNAKVFGTDGSLRREFLLGDGIEHVQVDRKGNIWVGYFDEGVNGNFGWGHSINRLGASGLTCFDAWGERLWDFQPPAGCDPISDCYALNVSKDGIWTYYYTGFPFVRIDSDWKTRGWRSKTSGGREFAVHNQRILHFGGYGKERTSCKLLRLDEDSADLVAHVTLLLPEEVDLAKADVIGRDNKLNVFFDNAWYVFSIDSID